MKIHTLHANRIFLDDGQSEPPIQGHPGHSGHSGHRRNERVVHTGAEQSRVSGWYYTVRGGEVVGPFENHADAVYHLNRYIDSCRRRSAPQPYLPRWLHPRHWLNRPTESKH